MPNGIVTDSDRIIGLVARDAAILAQVLASVRGKTLTDRRFVHVIVADKQYQNLQCGSARVRCRQDLQPHHGVSTSQGN
jgi:hypothetical protein